MQNIQVRFKIFAIKQNWDSWFLFGIDFVSNKCYFLEAFSDKKSDTQYLSIEEARKKWKNLLSEGYENFDLKKFHYPKFLSDKLKNWSEFTRLKSKNISSHLTDNPWQNKEETKKLKKSVSTLYSKQNENSKQYEEPQFLKDLDNAKEEAIYSRGTRHILYLMSKDTQFAFFAIDKQTKSCVHIVQGNSYSQSDKELQTQLIHKKDIRLKRKELYDSGFRDFYEGIVSGLVFERIGAWIGILKSDEKIVIPHLLEHWKDNFKMTETPKMIEITHNSDGMILMFNEITEYEEDAEPSLAVKVNTGLNFEEDLDNYWNQEGVFEAETDKSDQFL